MSSTGATLSGSFSGETGIISETGFYYKLSTSSGWTQVQAYGTSSPFSKAISGLSPGKSYDYKAYVKEYSEAAGDYVEREGSASSFTTKKVATATVQNSAATNVTSSGATLNGSYSGASGTISDRGFRYRKVGTSNWTTIGLNSGGSPFSATISGLDPSTQYEFQAYVTELDESQGTNGVNVDRWASSTLTFTTDAVPTQTGWQAYLNDYGMPDVSDLGLSLRQSGTNTARDDKWYSINTSNSNRQIAVHTCDETVNYVVMYDGSRYAPLWTAHTMNTTYWPDNNATRENNWISDPAISLTQISGLDDNSTYSRGHFVASSYRKSSQNQNAQTFYYTNKAPQYQDGFNNGVWSSLEERVKTMAPNGSTTMLYVVTGVLYEGTLTYMSKGSLNVPIPSHFYKCIMKCTLNGSGTVTAAQGIAFVYTNVSHTGEKYYDSAYVTTIDAIEARAGFDFFAKVPASLQNAAEANKNHSWFTGQSSSNIDAVTDNNWGTL